MEGMFGLLGGLAGGAMQMSAAQTAAVMQWMNLQFQKQNADRQFRLSTAGRTDAYGNKQSYNPLTDEWELALSPTQGKIIKAGEAEQLRSLTEDAARNRAIKVRQAERGTQAAGDYNRARLGFMYDQPKSAKSTESDLAALIAGQQQEARKGTQAGLIRQALRLGRGGDVAQIIRSTDDTLGGSLSDTLLKARQGGLQENATQMQQHAQMYLPELQRDAALMDQGGDMPLRFSDQPDKLAAMQGEQYKGILQALQNESSNVGGAYNGLSTTYAKNFPSMWGSLGKGQGSAGSGGGGRGSGQSRQQKPTEFNSSGDGLFGDPEGGGGGQPNYSMMQNPNDMQDMWTGNFDFGMPTYGYFDTGWGDF